MDWRCPECGYEDGGSHYHCANCGGVCSMMGHRPEQCDAYRRKQMAKSKKTDANEPDDPPMTGPTMAHATHDGEAPLLTGREGDDLQTVTLEGGGPGAGTFRAAVPIPIVLISNGARYVLSDREQALYAWQA